MTEAQGCALLKQHFVAAGYDITDNYPFSEQGVTFSIDGFDPVRRVGYEYITTSAGDREDVHPGIVAALEHRMTRGELFLLLIDEREVLSAADLASAAEHFLKRVTVERAERKDKAT
ncbi:MAG: hypothetical protein U1A78_19975 [Polyangia bacterium]